jgi:hypothetical protein
MTLLDFSNLAMRFEPFPIGIARPVMAEDTYRYLVESFPPVDLFEDYAYLGKPGQKLTLSEKENPAKFRRFAMGGPRRDFYKWIKSQEFSYYIVDVLKDHDVDLGFRKISRWSRAAKVVRNLSIDYCVRNPALRSRFEFSILRGDGGFLPPHTDAPSKAATIIVSMARPGEWNPTFGGGTSVNRPRHLRFAYNKMNAIADFADMEVVETYPFMPNQAIIFVKTHNSWHAVEPIRAADPTLMRRTLTINIEMY